MIVKCGFLGGLIALAVLLAAVPAGAAAERDVYAVAAVPVDATAANAAAARDTARLDGEKRAYQTLLDRLTLATDHDRLPRIGDAALADLVSGFEVANERSSGVRYLANYTFHFRADKIRQLLRQAGISFAETMSRRVVVLAVLLADPHPVLWEDPNPWRDAWGAAHLPRGLVPFVLPYGEIEDIAAIDADSALSGDPEHLAAVAKRYDDADILVTRAALKTDAGPRRVEVTSTRFDPGDSGTDQSWTGSYAASSGESDEALLGRAVLGTSAQVEDAWKSANILNFSQVGTMVVRVPASDLESWLAIRDRLAEIPAIQRSDLQALDRQGARIAIHFVGDPAQLRLALAQRNLALTGQDPDWVLGRRTDTAPP